MSDFERVGPDAPGPGEPEPRDVPLLPEPLSEPPAQPPSEPPAEAPAVRAAAPEPAAPRTAAPEPTLADAPGPPPRPRRPGLVARALAERPEPTVEVPAARLRARARRDFLLWAAGALAATTGALWLLPPRSRARLVPGAGRWLDSALARLGLTGGRREAALDRALDFDDDVAEALYSRDRRVRTYARSQTTPLRNNYNGATPGPEYLATWRLRVRGLADGGARDFTLAELVAGFLQVEQVTRLVCVEGWSAVAWWGGIPFARFLAAFPPAAGARWAALRSSVNLDGDGNPDPYYVSIDLETARHPQTLLATRFAGRPLAVEHGAPLRLVAPMKLGLKNIKAITEIEYTAGEPPDYWNERGYSRYDGL